MWEECVSVVRVGRISIAVSESAPTLAMGMGIATMVLAIAMLGGRVQIAV